TDSRTPARPLPLSQRLAQIVEEPGPDRLTFSELATQLHARAWGGLLVIFAAINVIPLPPGASIFFAVPLIIVTAQMAFGRASPWFPARIDRRGVTKEELRRLIAKMEWIEVRVERMFKPRLATLTGPTATRLIGIVCFILALMTMLPIVHVAPAAVIVLFGLALIYRDGALIIAAAVTTLVGAAIAIFLISSGAVAISYVARRFGF
ncbi:MAG TPA: exopolysaccharide biosynthesis protein, partial [Sphingomicrobium sp.]|nr:exopolysaccharide biosynthesis protein [Sphingomicrobium sp.]